MTIHQISLQNYNKIGSGFCGTVWARDLDGDAIKREDGGPSRSLANDFAMHQRAVDAFRKLSSIKADRDRPSVRIPQCHRFITLDDLAWWTEHLPFFPPGFSPCNALCAQRIPPFSEDIRALIVERYCHCAPELRQNILSSQSNQACLIRPYIGRQRTYGTAENVHSRFRGFSLQNFPLHIDQMEEIGMSSDDIDRYASMMGEALATLHWLGEIDGNDVEFVLAPLPIGEKEESGTNTVTINNALGQHTMWILDFDLCHSLDMSTEGLGKAVDAFFKNDPFTPRPNTKHWTSFRRQYLQTARLVMHAFHENKLNEQRHLLPSQFIEFAEQRRMCGSPVNL